jgi:hypothetical protein
MSILITVGAANLFDQTTNSGRYSKAFPAVVCPPNPAGVTTVSSLASSKSLFHRVGTKNTDFKKINTFRYSTVKDALLVQSEGSTPISFQSRKSVWAGTVICAAPATSQWFVGGTSDVSSKGHLDIVNSGLSTSIVDIFTWSENGERPVRTISIKANSSISLKLDMLAPGDSKIAIKVVARSGRVNSFLIDERGRGLKALGGDSVNSISEPSKTLVIVGIPQKLVKKKALSHYLRLFVPGDISANFSLELLSTDGRFIPLGFNEVKLPNGKVVELKLTPAVPTGAFAVRISSDQPLLAAIRSATNSATHSDFVWSTPSAALTPLEVGIAGISPKLVITGDSIAINLALRFSSGKIMEKLITGSDLITWQVPNKVTAIKIISSAQDNFVGALVETKSGSAFFPISAGVQLTKAAIPVSNIEVLNP